ncbi:MAG: 50S ribosomal protein L35 [Candidatus Magasanikbacteria bacterium]|jgi:ribosomal protein L35|nr:50S ribosomal protein L35 [Candidatus Magasanikbacteria bacterium]
MSKLKTHKATAKRFMVKRSKKGIKIIKRTNGQDHFNARETGKVKRNKRSDATMTNTVQQTILRAMPYC